MSDEPRFMIEPTSAEALAEFDPDVFAGMEEEYESFPSAMLLIGRDPELARICMRLVRHTLFREGKVEPGLRWLAGHLASRAAGCRYCTAHTAYWGVRFAALEPAKAEAAWEFETSDAFSEAERAALRFAVACGSVPNAVTREHFDDLHKHWDDDQIVELGAAICLFGFMNRWNDSFSTPLESEPFAFAERHLRAGGWDPGKNSPRL